MVCELERVLQVYDGLFCSKSVAFDGAVLLLHNQATLNLLLTLTRSQLSDVRCVVILTDF